VSSRRRRPRRVDEIPTHTHKTPQKILLKKIGIWEGKEETKNCSRSRRSRGKKTAREVPGVLRKEKKKTESENHEIFR
jgi:hypothetical protein